MAKVNPRLIELTIDSVDVSDQVSKAAITSAAADGDWLSFSMARSGGNRDYTLTMTIAQDHVADTLWDQIWAGAGTEVTGLYAPYGNATASATEPHYSFTAVISEPDGDFMGGEATLSTSAVATIDVAWKLTGKPTKVTA